MGVEVRWGAKLSKIEEGKENIMAHFEDGSVVEGEGDLTFPIYFEPPGSPGVLLLSCRADHLYQVIYSSAPMASTPKSVNMS